MISRKSPFTVLLWLAFFLPPVFAAPAVCHAETSLVQAARLTGSDAESTDGFAYSCAIFGDTVVAGSPWAKGDGVHNTGAVYVFEKPASGWVDMTQTARLTVPDGLDDDWFGYRVCIYKDTIAVSRPGSVIPPYDSRRGTVYVFEKPQNGWRDMTPTAELTLEQPCESCFFGLSLTMSDDTIVVASMEQAHVFEKPETGWHDMTPTAKLIPTDSEAYALSVSISHDTLVMGNAMATVNGNEMQGAAYVFVKPEGGWRDSAPVARLTALDGGVENRFGFRVSISGDTLLVNALGHVSQENGYAGDRLPV